VNAAREGGKKIKKKKPPRKDRKTRSVPEAEAQKGAGKSEERRVSRNRRGARGGPGPFKPAIKKNWGEAGGGRFGVLRVVNTSKKKELGKLFQRETKKHKGLKQRETELLMPNAPQFFL